MGLEPMVIEKNQPGGVLVNANLVENYPGFPGGISGPEIANRFVTQANSFNIYINQDEILLVDFSNGVFTLNSKTGYYQCNILVIATGTSPVIPENCPENLVREGLVNFDISSLRLAREKTIGIIGAGDAAFDYSFSLAQNDNNILIFNRGNQIKALKILQEKVFINNKIKYLENTMLKSMETQTGKGFQAIFNSASSNKKYSLDYLIFATGRKPENGFLRESLKGKLPGLLKERRLYLIGDFKNGNYRQVSVAVGDGVRAAMEIFQDESNQ
jgi:thioredoxin reductase (NADPH)